MSNTRDNHVILNCGDMKKDGPSQDGPWNTVFKKSISNIVDEDCITGDGSFAKLKAEVSKQLLENVKKYAYTNLPPIPEDNSLDDSIEKINKDQQKILPSEVTNIFIDASMKPKKYVKADSYKIIETPASNIDPGGREDTTHFAPSSSININLHKYGFKKDSVFEYNQDKNKKFGDTLYNYISIFLDSENYFQGLIDRNGNIYNDESEIYIDGEKIDINMDYFKGNEVKNSYIKHNYTTKENKDIINLLIFFKELGDTMQAIIIEYLLKYVFSTYTSANTCLLTIDTILATRSKMLNVPYLLKSNSILTYFTPLDPKEYDYLMKRTIIFDILANNKIVSLELNTFILDQPVYSQIVSGRSRRNTENKRITKEINIRDQGDYKITHIISAKFESMQKTIAEINTDLNKIKNFLLNPDDYSVSGVPLKIKYKFLKLKEICDLPFIEFKILIASLTAKSIYINVRGIRKIIIGKYSLFPDFINLISTNYLVLDNPHIFPNGIVSYIQANQNSGGGANSSDREINERSRSRSRSPEVDDKINSMSITNNLDYAVYLYSLLHPFIYIYPYLLPYLLNLDTGNLDILYQSIFKIILDPTASESDKIYLNSLFPDNESIDEIYLNELMDENKTPIDYSTRLLDTLITYTSKPPPVLSRQYTPPQIDRQVTQVTPTKRKSSVNIKKTIKKNKTYRKKNKIYRKKTHRKKNKTYKNGGNKQKKYKSTKITKKNKYYSKIKDTRNHYKK